ncbi:MAG: helix-turn-helix domain-containing protein [Cellulophaga sp.]|uniref:helix-turn-helix domain-containing protein n=1 Tax=Cellulophaga sp. RHA19 TaxID=1798237 RepID=UPI000C2CCC1E|nr:AraC family transcriptional regulator [Cellulophaga sp. RHA19]PKB45095.1 AraC family transcriptional regulator [Cellulophaga sp. RHA19]
MSLGLKSFTYSNTSSMHIVVDDALTDVLEENCLSTFVNEENKGISLNSNYFIAFTKNTTIKKRIEHSVFCDFPLFKIHFSLKGSYVYMPTTSVYAPVEIQQGYCNLFYAPVLSGSEIFTKGETKTLEVYFTKNTLEKLIGKADQTNIDGLHTKLNIDHFFSYFKKSKRIPLKLRNQINEIINCTYVGDLKHNYIQSRLAILIVDFLMDKTKPVVESKKLPEADYLAIVKVEEYCRLNLKSKLTIIGLSQIAGFNTTKLKSDFKKVYKTTIFKHITQLRMDKARQLIQEEGMSIAEVSYEVGYSNPQHFTAAFKKTIGYLPSKLIK